MEIYNDNDPSKGVRPQVRAFHLPSEPWLFAINREGVVSAAIEGAFGIEADGRSRRKGGGGMSDKAAADDTELLESFAEEARRRCDVIAAGLATATTDFETMRAEAHALRGTAGVVGLRRLAELAGLMESDLAEAKKTGDDPRRPRPPDRRRRQGARRGRRRGGQGRGRAARRRPLPRPAVQRLSRRARAPHRAARAGRGVGEARPSRAVPRPPDPLLPPARARARCCSSCTASRPAPTTGATDRAACRDGRSSPSTSSASASPTSPATTTTRSPGRPT